MLIQHLTPEILRDAAKNWLVADDGTGQHSGVNPYGSSESCCAVHCAADSKTEKPKPRIPFAYTEICNLLKEMEGYISSNVLYGDIPPKNRLLARQLWLLFLADVIEDGGL